jgi:uncharacterized RDD family membrane protein YckC
MTESPQSSLPAPDPADRSAAAPAKDPGLPRPVLAVCLLCTLTLLGQFLLPRLVKRIMVPLGILGGVKVEAQQVNNAALWNDRVWYARNIASIDEGNQTQLVSIPTGGGEPEAAAVLPMVEPWLLADGDRLLAFSTEAIAEFRDAQVRVLAEASPLKQTSRPFLYDGRPAVLDSHAAGHSLLTWRDGQWTRESDFTIVIDGRRQDVANEELQAFQIDDELHLFCRPPSQPIYHRVGLPGEDLEDDPAWKKVVDLGFLQQWRAIPVYGEPCVFYHDDRRSGGPFIVGLRPSDDRWENFFSHPVGADIGLGALAGDKGEDFILLRRILPLGVEVYGVRGKNVVWTAAESGDVGLSARYRFWSNLPHLVPPVLAGGLAVVLSLVLPRMKPHVHALADRAVPYASPVRRGLALAVDSAIFLTPLVVFGYSQIAPVLARPTLGAAFGAAGTLLCLGSLWLLVTLVAVSLLEGLWGRTPGKWLTGIRVARTDLSRPGFGMAALRNLIRPLDAVQWYLVALLTLGLTRRWQRLGDLAAGTVVVRNRSVAPPQADPQTRS